MDTNIIFNSNDAFFKSPYGAVPSGTKVSFAFLVKAEVLHPWAAQLVISYDRHMDPVYYDMYAEEVSWYDQSYLRYTTDIAIEDSGLYWYHFQIDTPWGKKIIGKAPDRTAMLVEEGNPTDWQLTVYNPSQETPDWIYGGVYYHIFVDRFARSQDHPLPTEDPTPTWTTLPGKRYHRNWEESPDWQLEDGEVYNRDFFGGDLKGIQEKLPYLADLGITCLYLSPIFEAYSNHKYDTGNYRKIDSMFGEEEDFQSLCSAAKKLGMRVILDGVFAHTGADSIYFDKYQHYHQNGAWGNLDSPYHEWYCFNSDGTYESWWGIDTLPRLDKSNPDYTEFICGEDGVVRHWLRKGASGWRLDVADELDTPFLQALYAAAKEEKSDAMVLGEVWEDASNKIAYGERKNYFEGDKLDTVMNYPFRTGIIDFVRGRNAESLAGTVESICENYPPFALHSLMNLLGTHDSIRILTALAGEDLGGDPSRDLQAATHLTEEQKRRGLSLLRIAAALQMTLPGVPCVYYGDEAGLEGYKDPFNRAPYPWGKENKDLQNWYRTLIRLRKSEDVYRTGGYHTFCADNTLYAFYRYQDGCNSILTAANSGDEPRNLYIHGPHKDLLTGEILQGDITLQPLEVRILRVEK